MTFLKPISASAILAAILCATTAQADVTAEQVWKDWVDYATQMGQTISAESSDKQGDTLVVTNVKMASEMPEVSSEGTIAEVRLKEMGDGTVEITMSNEIPFHVKATPAEGKPSDMTMKFTQTGMTVLASGTPEAMDYTFNAPEMALSMDEMKAEGDTAPVKMQLTFKGNSGTYHTEKAAGRTMAYDMKSDTLDVALAGADPEGKGTFNLTGTMAGLTGNGTMAMPEGADFKDMNAALGKGAAMKGDFAYTSGTYKIESTGTDGAFTADTTGAEGKLHFAMSKDGIEYGGEAGQGTIAVSGASLPFPVEMSVAQTAFNMAMPVTKSDAPAPGALMVKLVDLKVSDALWNMVDPQTKLPRDPATLIIDLSGAIRPLIDLFDPKQAEALAAGGPSTSPFEISEAKINQLQIKAVGAELNGTGAVTFDNTATPPKPVGAIDLTLTGANKLMDNLVAAGLVPEDQIMGARMMLGLFAVPTGDDAMASKIEFKDDGGIYANGQRIQ
jgi:hypothetical protein